MAVLVALAVDLTYARTAIGVGRAWIALGSADAVRIVSVGQAVTVVVAAVAALGLRKRCDGTAVGRANALLLARAISVAM